MIFRKKTKIKRPLARRIINYFIGAGVVLIVIFLLAFGFTQTSSFRNWLKNFVVEQANSSTNGKLAIEGLDGTIFTSLILSKTVYTLEDDTLFSAGKIELKVSILKVFLKTIYLRKLEIDDAKISLLKDENGELNISRITSPSKVEEKKDTVSTSEPFNWKIEAADLKITNLNFRQQSFVNRGSTAEYAQPDMDNFRLNNINLSLTGAANIADNEYNVNIKAFSVKPNLIGFNLLNLSGNFVLASGIAGVKDLNIVTERSNIKVNAAISDFSPFDGDDLNLKSSPVKVELDATNFNFDDLTNFVSGTDLLKGNVETHLSAAGKLADLELKKLEIKFNETRLEASGFLKNILSGTDMIISTRFKDSFVNQDDIKNLLPTISIPSYKEYGVLQFDSLYFEGKPLQFNAGLLLNTNKGSIAGNVNMDLTGEEILYDYNIKTKNLNLAPIAGIKTNLNLICALKGKGFSPQNLETSVQINALKSSIGEISFKQFAINANGANGTIKTEVSFSSLETLGNVSTNFDFTDSINTKYNFAVVLNGFNIKDFVKENELTSDLNIKLTGDGENFDQDRLNLFAVLEIDSSKLNNISIDSTTLIADIRSSVDNRVINIISDLADLTIEGKFTLSEIIDVISEETNMLSSSIKNKIERIQPPNFTSSEPESINKKLQEKTTNLLASKNIDVKYLLELKSFELLSLFLSPSEIEVNGEISGNVFSMNDSVSVVIDTKITQLKYWDGLELFYLSDFDLSLVMNDRISVAAFDDFKADIKIDAKRIFVGSEITNLNFVMNFDNNYAQVNLSAVYDGLADLDLTGSILVNDNNVEVTFKKFLMKYRELDIQNKNNIEFSYSDNKFNFQAFTLVHNGGEVDLNGEFSLAGDEELSLKINKFKMSDLSANLLGISRDKSFAGELNLDLEISGSANNPQIDLSYSVDSIKIQNLYLGSLKSIANYSDKLVTVDLSFYEKENVESRHSFGVSGKIPIDLALFAKERFSQGEIIDLTLFADNFDLRFITGLIPGITNLKGSLNGEVKFSGSYEDLQSKGEFSIGNTSFILKANNLTYLLDGNFKFENEKIILSNLHMRNEPDIKDGGVITAAGEIVHQNFKIDRIDLHATGDLKLLDERSRAINPYFFGNIAVKTRGEIVYTSTKERNYLSADLILKNGANIIYSPAQSAFTNENDKFIYIFASTSEEDLMKRQIDSLIQVSQKKKEELARKIPFDLDLKIEVEKEAKMVFVLSKEFKQNLTTYLGGNFEYSVVDNFPVASGELTLLDGSKLDFIKTFQAEGSVKFLDELDNPYINVTAKYESSYSPDTLRSGANDYDVQVRIKLEGPAKNLTTNFLRNENNIEVYKKRRNYSQYELDPSKTASDAIFFIIANKFPEDATFQESNLALSTAASLAGSIVGAVLNEKFGDVVRSVKVQQVGTETQFNLIGKVEEFRYEIGGTSQVFQDLSRANVKIERPIIFPNLIIRFDRREPSYQSATFSEMINELGLKYSFIF
jgi:hypothetical protein